MAPLRAELGHRPVVVEDQSASRTTAHEATTRPEPDPSALGKPEGLVLPPLVYADVTNDTEIAREELFGPVAPVIRARGEEDALRIANDTAFGLSSCVFTADIERGTRFAQRLETGMAHVNDQPVNDLPNNPLGGEKNSGPRHPWDGRGISSTPHYPR